MKNIQETIKAVQELTAHNYTEKELRSIHTTINKVMSYIEQPRWAIENSEEREELQELLVQAAIVGYYRKKPIRAGDKHEN